MKKFSTLSILFLCLPYLMYSQCDSQRDSLALVALYNSTDGANWTSPWDLSTPYDTWNGVTINGEGCVTCLDLDGENNCGFSNTPSNNLTGNLSPELGDLSELTALYIYNNNNLSGIIPSELGNLSQLVTLYLNQNNLIESIPSELGQLTKIEGIYLNSNNLRGTIPPELGNLSTAKWLVLDDNILSGSIPAELSNLNNLIWLTLVDNFLSGNIPADLGNMSNLKWLLLERNNLSGNIPSELGNISTLARLELSQNQLTGNIPSELGSLEYLRNLYLFDNQLTGNIPPELGNLPNLLGLYLADNQLDGCFPPELMTHCGLESNDNGYYTGYNFTGNPLLPWQGDYERVCNNESQIGAPCDDGIENNGVDFISEDCTCVSSNMTAILHPIDATFFSVFPNPTRDDFHFRHQTDMNLTQVNCTNIWGQEMNIHLDSTRDLDQMYIEDAAAGLYIITIQGKEKVYVAKVMIHAKD